ncbi:hypothetical protein QGN31_23385 [Mycobacterium sp. 2-64]|uniref:hypothetical protein n=1 Tax=Mycobacterium sp. 2-64 TaxID=3042319 RepID=UPI002DD999BF|nr:hypothetical protein [Mycobacterium sp. 2-64]WSE54290.1 hypothetical protein QGN31_23385 [Mycobacterium sp. 2-64]
MINKFREFAARAAVLAADESGMSTVEYSINSNYSIEKGNLRGRPGLGSRITRTAAKAGTGS